MRQISIVIFTIAFVLFFGCRADQSELAEPSFTIEDGLSLSASLKLDSLFSLFPSELTIPSECDTFGVSERVDSAMDGLSLRHQVAQLLIVPLVPGRNGQASINAFRMVRDLKIGGFLVPRLLDPEEIAIQSAELQYHSEIPLFFAADYERGVGRFNNSFTELPSNMAIGATGQAWLAAAAGRLTGVEARSIGVNLLFAPVVDVNSNPDNPIINIRSYGDDPYRVALNAAAFIGEVERFGITSTIKHFPGHGSSATDSHTGIAVVADDLKQLEEADLVPFMGLIEMGHPPGAVMTGHISVGAIDPTGMPATLSEKVIENYLKAKTGFDGLIITDDLRMGAIANEYPLKDRLLLALQAGNDILLTPEDAARSIEIILLAIEEGELDVSYVAEAAKRIIKTKYAKCIESPGYRSHVAMINNTQPGKRIAKHIAGEAVTLLEAEEVPEWESIDIHQIANYQNSQTVENAKRLVRMLVDSTGNNESDASLIVLYARLLEGSGTAGFSTSDLDRIDQHLKRSSKPLVVLLGNPYLATHFAEGIPVVIGYDQSEASVLAVIDVINGKRDAKGVLPVDLSEEY